MMNLFTLTLVGLFASLAIQQAQANGQVPLSQSTYLIKGKLIRNIPDGITQLRRFMPRAENKDLRCQKMAVMLQSLKGNNVDGFQIAETGLARGEFIATKFKMLDVDGLRNLYIDAINSFIESQRADSGLMELIDCLSNKFRAFDAKARSYLNDPQLRAIIDQYRAVSEEPLRVLQYPNEHRLNIRFADLHPIIARRLEDLLYVDSRELASYFPDQPAPPKRDNRPPPPSPGAYADASARAGGNPNVAPANPEPRREVPQNQMPRELPRDAAPSRHHRQEVPRETRRETPRSEMPRNVPQQVPRNVPQHVPRGYPQEAARDNLPPPTSAPAAPPATRHMPPVAPQEDPHEPMPYEMPNEIPYEMPHEMPHDVPHDDHYGAPDESFYEGPHEMPEEKNHVNDAEPAPPMGQQDHEGLAELDEESKRYFAKVFASIAHVYDTLPIETRLADRCQAYNAVINSEEADLDNERHMRKVAEGRIRQMESNDMFVLPTHDDKENFIFALGYAEVFMVPSDEEALFDLKQCAEHMA